MCMLAIILCIPSIGWAISPKSTKVISSSPKRKSALPTPSPMRCLAIAGLVSTLNCAGGIVPKTALSGLRMVKPGCSISARDSSPSIVRPSPRVANWRCGLAAAARPSIPNQQIGSGRPDARSRLGLFQSRTIEERVMIVLSWVSRPSA